MADQNYTVEITDKVASSIPEKIERISTASLNAHSSVEKLKSALAAIDSKALEAMSVASARAQRMLDASALASQKLATEAQRTASASNAAATAQQKLATATAQTQISTQRLATAQAQTAAATSNAAAAAARAATAQSNQAAAALRLQNAQNKVNSSMTNYVQNAVRLAAAGLGAREILQSADAYTTLNNKLQVVSKSQAQVTDLSEKLFDLANRTRAPVEETATAFTRFDRALSMLGKTQDDSLRLTETVNKALVNSGATATEAGSALLQLSQAFNSGRLQGDEFRSLSENMPVVLDALSKAMGKPVSQLKQLASEGKITSAVLFDAFKIIEQQTDDTFGKTIQTLGQAINVFRNNFIKAIGEVEKATGIFSGLANVISAISNNFRTIAVIIATVGSGLAVAFAPAIIASIGSAVKALQALALALYANPIIIFVAALTGLITYLVLFRDKSEIAKAAVDNIGFALDALGGTIRGLGIFLGRFFSQVIDGSINGIKQGYNAVVEFIENTTNTAIKGINYLRDFAGKEPIDLVKFDRLETQKTDWTKIGQLWGELLNEGFEQQDGTIQKMLNGKQKDPLQEIVVKSRKIQDDSGGGLSKEAEKRATAMEKVNLQLDNEISRLQMLQPMRDAQARFDQIEETLAGKKIHLDDQEEASIKRKIDAIIKETQVQAQRDQIYESAIAPQRDYLNTLAAADDLLKRGVITQEIYNRSVSGAAEAWANSLDPLRQVNQQIDEENKLLSLIGPQREIEQRLQQIINEKKQENIVLSGTQIEQLREELIAQNALQAAKQAEAEVYDAVIGSMQAYYDKLQAISSLQGLSQGQRAQQTIEANPEFDFELTQTGIDAHLQQYQDMYDKIDAMKEKSLINDQTAEALRNQVRQRQREDELKGATEFFGYMAQLSKSENSKIAAIGKAAAITKAVIDTYTSATGAYASLSSIPIVGPALGAAAAAAAITAGMENVNKIRSQGNGFMSGGYTGNSPINQAVGSVHGQEYVMNARATRRIGVENLDAMQRGAAGVQQNVPNWQTMAQQKAPQVSVGGPQIVVVKDPNEIPTALRSPGSQQSIVMAIGENAGEIKNLLGV